MTANPNGKQVAKVGFIHGRRNFGEQEREVSVWFQAISLGRFDQAEECGAGLGAVRPDGKLPVLAT